MRFLVDRCAGRGLAECLRENGHDVIEARDLGPDPGDEELLRRAFEDYRILGTIDTTSESWSTSSRGRIGVCCDCQTLQLRSGWHSWSRFCDGTRTTCAMAQ
jgi:hypothetical protein